MAKLEATIRICKKEQVKNWRQLIIKLINIIHQSLDLLQWIHAETLVHSGCVWEDGGQDGFEYETEVQSPVSHSLVEDGITASLTNDDISPLHDDNWYEESGVACELQCLTVSVGLKWELRKKYEIFCKIFDPEKSIAYPFLSIRVSQIVDGLRVPMFTDTEQFSGQESIFSHDDEVDEETSSCLNHTDLTICHRNKSARRELWGKRKMRFQNVANCFTIELFWLMKLMILHFIYPILEHELFLLLLSFFFSIYYSEQQQVAENHQFINQKHIVL